jgi:hypothetical protein
MFPEPKHSPALTIEVRVGRSITLAIPGDLLLPKFAIAARDRPMNVAAVPKAAVDENGNLFAGKSDINRPSAMARDGVVHTVSGAPRKQ